MAIDKYENMADRLEEQAEIARKATNDAERAERAARTIASERQKQKHLMDQIGEYAEQVNTLPRAGNIKRFVGAPLSIISVIDPTYKAAQAQIEGASIAKGMEVFAKSYARQVRDSIATLGTGKDFLKDRKYGEDILIDQLGMKKGWKTAALGIGMDIGGDAGSFMSVGIKPMLSGLGAAGRLVKEYASKAPAINKGIEGLSKRLNIFYEIEKTMPAADVKEFKNLFREATVTRDLSKLKAFGQQAIDAASSATKNAGAAVDSMKSSTIAAVKRDIGNLTASIEGAKAKWINAATEQGKLYRESLATLFKDSSGLNISEKWLSGSGMSLKDASAPLLSLPTEVKRQVMQSVEQWTHIIAKNTQAQAYKNFANELLPRLQQGLGAKQINEAAKYAKTTYDDLVAQLSAAKSHLDLLTKPSHNLKITPQETLKIQPNTQPQAYRDIIYDAFESELKSGWIGKSIDKVNAGFKMLLSWLPNFQIRNALGTANMAIAEGARLQDFWKAGKMFFQDGKPNATLWQQFVDNGLTKQTGMYEVGTGSGKGVLDWLTHIPGKFSNLTESVGRMSVVFADLRKDVKTLDEAIEHSQDTFYRYGKEYFTKFEQKYLKRIDMFYPWDKGQGKYWTTNLAEKAPFWNKLYKIFDGFKDDDDRKNPMITPDHRTDQFTLGKWNNVGFPLEDWLRMITLDLKTLSGHTQIIGRNAAEFALDFRLYQEKPLSDPSAGMWQHAPGVLQSMVGYNSHSNTVNPYLRHLFENIPQITPLIGLGVPDRSWIESITSLKQQNTSIDNYMAQAEMQSRGISLLDHQKDRLNRLLGLDLDFGPRSGSASAGVDEFVRALAQQTATQKITNEALRKYNATVDKHNAAFEASKAGRIKGLDPALFGERYVYGLGAEQSVKFNFQQKINDVMADAMAYTFPNLGEGAAASSAYKIKKLQDSAYYYGQLNDPGYQAALKALTEKEHFMRPRMIGVDQPYFKSDDFVWRRLMGRGEKEQYYNKALEERISFTSKTGDIWKASIDRSPQAIAKSLQAELDALAFQVEAQGGGISDKMTKSRIDALYQQAQHNMDKLEARANTATANILKDWAKAQGNAFNKLELERQAAIKEYYGSQDYRDAYAAKDFDKIRNAINAKNAAFAQQRKELIAKEAKAQLDYLKTVTEGGTKNIIDALTGIYKRGGKQIAEYYDEVLKASIDSVGKISAKAIETAIAVGRTHVETREDELTTPKVPDAPIRYHKQKQKTTTVDAKVHKILDADTIDIMLPDGKVQRVRMAYVDAPETAKPAFGNDPARPSQPFGDDAKALATELLGGVGGSIKVTIVGVDTNDRLIGEIFNAKGQTVDQELVKAGFAEIVPKYMPNKATYDKYAPGMQSAIDNGLGMYNPAHYQGPASFRHEGGHEAMRGNLVEARNLLSTLKDLQAVIDNGEASPQTRLHALNQAIEIISQKLPDTGVEISSLKDALKILAEKSAEAEKTIADTPLNIEKDKAKLRESITDLKANAAKMRADIYAATGVRTLGIRSYSGAGAKFGYSTSPFAPMGYNQDDEALKAKKAAIAGETSSFFQKNTDLEGELAFRPRGDNQSNTDYLKQIEEDLQKHEDNKANISELGREKLKALQENYASFTMKSESAIAIHAEQQMQKRLTVASDMVGMMTQTAQMLYEASGKESKEAFYVMKAMALAEAAIKGAQTVINAFNAGTSVGGPYAMVTGAAFASIAAAFVGAQIGVIAAQTAAGPGKAEGGRIEGGTGTKDDVPIMAMGGEFVIRKSSAQKYGVAFLDALNKGLIPVSDLNFNIPIPAPASYKAHYAEGGVVTTDPTRDMKKNDQQSVQIVNVIDPQLLDKYLASTAGQKTLVNVLAANRYELQQIMR